MGRHGQACENGSWNDVARGGTQHEKCLLREAWRLGSAEEAIILLIFQQLERRAWTVGCGCKGENVIPKR